MFATLLDVVKNEPDYDVTHKRRHPRRETDKCVIEINGQPHPVMNWSIGGVLIQADSRSFGMDNEIDMTMKFKLRDKIIDVNHRGRVVRKTNDSVAFEFLPVSDQIKRNFQNVIDDHVAAQFADSQA